MLNEIEERQFDELRRLGRMLRVPVPEVFLCLEVRDKSGRVVSHLKQRSHSWVRNAYNLMFSQLAGKDGDNNSFGAGYLSYKDTGGSCRYDNAPLLIGNDNDSTVDGTMYGYRAPANEDLWGIVIGSGDTAETFEDYACASQIANGTGAGQMSYIESEPHDINYNAGTKTLSNTFVRYFNNNSGGSIDVKEVALVNRNNLKSYQYKVLMSRDVLGATVTIPDTGQLKVTYTIQLTYPA